MKFFSVFPPKQQSSRLQNDSLKDESTAKVILVDTWKNERKLVDWKDLVPGNVIEIINDRTLCLCDAVILSGNCLVAESCKSYLFLPRGLQLKKSTYAIERSPKILGKNPEKSLKIRKFEKENSENSEKNLKKSIA